MIYLVSFILIAGSSFGLIAALGIFRMPDLYCRLHAATKAGAFGLSLLLLGLCLWQPEMRNLIQSMMIVFFFYLTAPVAAQMIGNVAILRGVEVWKSENNKK